MKISRITLLASMFLGLPGLGQETPKGLRLEDLERMALEANPTIGQAKALVDAAAGRAQQAGMWPNPTFGANGEHVSKVTGDRKSVV